MMICNFLSFGHLFQDYTFDMQSDIPALSIVSNFKWIFPTFLTIYNWFLVAVSSVYLTINMHFETFTYFSKMYTFKKSLIIWISSSFSIYLPILKMYVNVYGPSVSFGWLPRNYMLYILCILKEFRIMLMTFYLKY